MQKIIPIIVGLGLVSFGGYRQLLGDGVSPAEQARCEQLVKKQTGDDQDDLNELLPKCSDPGMVAMMNAKASGSGAQAAAQSIAAANKGDVGARMLDWFLLGVGFAALAGGFITGRRFT